MDLVNVVRLLSIMNPMISNRPSRRVFLAAALTVFVITACSDDPVGPGDGTVAGVDLDALFAEATGSEIDAIAEEWAARSVGAEGVEILEDTVVVQSGLDVRVRIVTHVVDDFRHVGAVLSVVGATGPLPVIVYTHGGDDGVAVEDVLFQFPIIGADAANFVWVVPSFRAERLRFAGQTWTSQGSPSPWDRDVDDAIALLDVTFAIEPAADSGSVGVLGFSRGSGVGLLMGIRDDRIDRIVEFFGPTDFLGPFVRAIAEEALLGQPRDLPGLDYLDEILFQPLASGEMTITEARLELVRRSAVLWAERLPAVQVHHGTADEVVAVSQAESLIAAMTALGRGEPDFQPYLYEGGTHSPFTLPNSPSRAVAFLRELLPAPLAN